MALADAVASTAIIHNGYSFNFGRKYILNDLLNQQHFTKLKNYIKCKTYPITQQSAIFVVALTMGMYYTQVGIVAEIVDRMVTNVESCQVDDIQLSGCKTVASVLVGLAIWLTLAFIVRALLKLLLLYKGWIYEQGGRTRRISKRTRLWFMALKVLIGEQQPALCSFQGVLPRLPVPSLKDTIHRYLQSVRPLYDDARYSHLEKLAADFQKGIGNKLQRYLIVKSWLTENYVSDWWEEYVYLRGRSPLIVNSNYYGIDIILRDPTHVQSARAAMIIHRFMKCQKRIELQKQKPLLIQGLIPLCSWQYTRLFNSTRIPGDETDQLIHYTTSNHVVVYHRGRYFKVIVSCNGQILKPCEIEIQIRKIMQDTSSPAVGEEKLAALTAGDRTHWAKIRRKYFSEGINKLSLHEIESAAFFVALDENPIQYDEKDPTKLENFGRAGFHGKGYDRWFDKSFTLIVGSNGHVGFNAEHTATDGAVMAQTWEYVLQKELLSPEKCYKEDGHTIGTPVTDPPLPLRLHWDLKDCLEGIECSVKVAHEQISDLDLRILVHNAYGKGFIKECHTSPDAYIQLALQLAYYRDIGRFTLTYETSMTRLFLKGRTETVRPCTVESTAWVKSMMDPSYTVKERMSLLQEACLVHTKGYKDAMCGKGVDRHLFCLYIVSKYLKVDAPFLEEALAEPWRLSTSQTPHNQIGKVDPRKHDKCITPAGGFGPTDKDGYGVSYIISGEDIIFFHVTSRHSSTVTDSTRFASAIQEALSDMKKLFLEWKEIQKHS